MLFFFGNIVMMTLVGISTESCGTAVDGVRSNCHEVRILLATERPSN